MSFTILLYNNNIYSWHKILYICIHKPYYTSWVHFIIIYYIMYIYDYTNNNNMYASIMTG